MAMDFTAAVDTLSQAQQRVREAQGIAHAAAQKLREVEAATRSAQQIVIAACEKLGEGRNALKTVATLGSIPGIQGLLAQIEELESNIRRNSMQRLERLHTVRKDCDENLRSTVISHMSHMIASIEQVKG